MQAVKVGARTVSHKVGKDLQYHFFWNSIRVIHPLGLVRKAQIGYWVAVLEHLWHHCALYLFDIFARSSRKPSIVPLQLVDKAVCIIIYHISKVKVMPYKVCSMQWILCLWLHPKDGWRCFSFTTRLKNMCPLLLTHVLDFYNGDTPFNLLNSSCCGSFKLQMVSRQTYTG